MKFSVIIPVYNKKDTLRRALDSVLVQTYRNFEVIVVDDGSTDGIDEVLTCYRAPRVIHQKNGGVSVARNTGIEAATGDFVCFLDADDRYERHHLATLNELIERYPEADLFFSSYRIQDKNGAEYSSAGCLEEHVASLYEKEPHAARRDFMTDNVIDLLNRYSDAIWCTNAMCLRRRVLMDEGLRFAVGERLGEDVDMWLRFSLRHKAAISLEETTIYIQADSTATKNGSQNHDWVFARREAQILSAADIRKDVKAGVCCLLDRYRLCCAREAAAEGEKKKARAFLSLIKNKHTRDYLASAAFCLLPAPLCRFVLKRLEE
ncbi:MAG: glycosyltransferase family 2 protein [Clostridia bacterium]|nr:glycosyltransferase family 2 protein [Clostridia bacterium]